MPGKAYPWPERQSSNLEPPGLLLHSLRTELNAASIAAAEVARILSNLTKPLSHFRLVATLPPKHFFGGNNFLHALAQIEALKTFGATVYAFDTSAVYAADRAEVERQAKEVAGFRPHAVIGTPNAGYIVQGGMMWPSQDRSQDRSRGARNVFLDDLDLPAIFYWDHVLSQPTHYLLNPLPQHPSESYGGMLGRLSELFRRPGIVHFFPDSGQAKALEEFGIGPFAETAWYVQGVARPFVECGADPELQDCDEDVAFYGNLYLAAAKALPYCDVPGLASLRAKASAACAADWGLPAYHAYSRAIADLDAETRSSLRLDHDQSFYWRFLHGELSRFLNGEHRLRILQSCGLPIACFGNFNDPESDGLIAEPTRVRGALPYNGALASAFRRTRIVLDAANAQFINGFSVKPLACFAAGGFVLTNRKSDLVRALGPVANEIIYDDAGDLAGKVDYFLSNDRARLELTREIGATVRSKYSSEALFARTVPAALDRLLTH